MTSPKIDNPKFFSWPILLIAVCFGVTKISCTTDYHSSACKESSSHSPSGILVAKFFHDGVCYVAGCRELTRSNRGDNWDAAKVECELMPRLNGFKPPILATVKMNKDEIAGLLYTAERKTHGCYYRDERYFWVGARIVGSWNYKHSDWRWLSDNSRLDGFDQSVWHKDRPQSSYSNYQCAVIRITPGSNGLVDIPCYSETRRFLCMYEAKGGCAKPTDKELPKDLTVEDKATWFALGYKLTVKCEGGRSIKGDKNKVHQEIKCENGTWTKPEECLDEETQDFLHFAKYGDGSDDQDGSFLKTVLIIAVAVGGLICIALWVSVGVAVYNMRQKDGQGAKQALNKKERSNRQSVWSRFSRRH